jgi:hypothetical protein
MTETERTALLSACSFARVFIESAYMELRVSSVDGFPTKMVRENRKRSAKQLQAALVNLDPKMAAIMAVLEED